jgi:small subunit ribosomal protein S1
MESTGLKQLINEYSYQRPRRGQLVEGEILLVDEKTIYLDIGTKRDAVVPIEDLEDLDEERVDHLTEGEQVAVMVTHPNTNQGELVVSISKGLELEDWERAERCLRDSELLELEVVGQNRGGLEVDFGLIRGFVPNSHLPDIRRHRRSEIRSAKKAEKIGTRLPLKVIEVDRPQKRLILSAREAVSAHKARRLQELEVGEMIEGRVVNLVDFGAFVDLGGIDGLIHVSEIAWERVNDPAEFLEVGDQVEVVVKEVDLERGRVGLSRKPLLPDPWETIEERYEIGAVVAGTITNVPKFGAFVRLESGIEGLVHVSEMNVHENETPALVVAKGDKVRVKILDIDPFRKRIALSVRQVPQEDRFIRSEPEIMQNSNERDEISGETKLGKLEIRELENEPQEKDQKEEEIQTQDA